MNTLPKRCTLIIKSVPPFSWLHRFLSRHRLLNRGTRPIALLNFIVQRVIGYNNAATWPVHFTSDIVAPDRIRLGKNVDLSFMHSGHCYYQAINGIEIGDDTIWAPGVQMISANHEPNNLEKHIPAEPIRIGKNCWIGANAVILPGVQLGDRTVVGAGAVVTKSFPEGRCVIAGNPARVLRRY